MGNPVVHFEIMANNAAATRDFYTRAFGWQFENAPGAGEVEYKLVNTNGNGGIRGGIGKSPAGYGGHVTFYVGVPDIETAIASVESLGGKRMMGPDQVPNGPIIALFTDPEDRTVGLVQIPEC
jgi:predicted enzyme related to lactoylglutathione lyase